MKKHQRSDLEARGHTVSHTDDRTHETVKAQLHQTLDRATGTIVERGNIARTPGVNSAKGQGAVPVHPSMRNRHAESINSNWRDLSPDANPAAAGPLDGGEPRGKMPKPVQPSFGMRSRIADTAAPMPPGMNHRMNVGRGVNSDLGKKIMTEATISGSNKLPEAPNYGGTVQIRPASK
jgi:hypothetical protein